ncbi:MAG: hypothetical protein U1D55_14865 [Phycisphaerae bacterium]
MHRIGNDEEARFKVYPGKDNRVLRVVKKVVRGLSHHHRIQSAVPESNVWADVMRFRVPELLLARATHGHRDPRIVQYWYEALDEPGMRSAWLVFFFERVPFIGIVASSSQ